jgi:cell division protein FtsL
MQRALCEDYLNDRLSDEERKAFEERIAKGDKELIETLNQLKVYRQQGGEFSHTEHQENQPENLLHFVSKTEKEEGLDSKKESRKNTTQPALADVIQEAEQKQHSNSKQRFVVAVGAIMIAMILFLTYQQWNSYSLQQKVQILEQKLELLEKENDEHALKNRNLTFYLNRVKSLILSDFFTSTRLELDQNRGTWIQLWDKGTLRTVVVLDKPRFNPKEVLQLWSQNTRTREWQLVGSIDKIKEDSMYVQWDTQMLARSRGLQIKLLALDEKEEFTEKVLAQTTIR